MGGGGIETNGSKKEKGRSQGALKLFVQKQIFLFRVCPNFNSCKL